MRWPSRGSAVARPSADRDNRVVSETADASGWRLASGPLRWSGERWVPAAVFDDRAVVERPVPKRRTEDPKWLRPLFGSWFAGLGIWVPATGVAHSLAPRNSLTTGAALLGSAAIGLVFTVVVGFVLGRRRMWQHIGIATGLGTGALLFWYIVAMIVFTPASDASSDNAAGAGLVLLFIPTLVAISAVLYLGGVVGRFGPWSSRAISRSA